MRLTVASIALLTACAHQPPERQPPAVSVPVPLIRQICDHAHPEQGSGHFDGRAQLLWNTDGAIVAVECFLTVRTDGLSTTSVQIGLQDERARGLREFLSSRATR